MKKYCASAALALLLGWGSAGWAAEAGPRRGAVHIHTDASTGDGPAEEVVKEARGKGIRVLIFTDSALRRWEYTLFPWLGPIFKKTVEQPSVLKMGAGRYFAQLRALQKKYPDTLILPATEAAPHYFWEGSPFQKNLTLRDWQKHLLVIGLDERATRRLPLASNPHRRGFHWRSLVWLWPAAAFWVGWRLTRLRKVFQVTVRGVVLKNVKSPFRFAGLFLMILSGAVLAVNFPFMDSKYPPMSGFQGAGPYQDLIDHAVAHGGLVFWAHPEAKVDGDAGNGIGLNTPAYPELLLQTDRYHGFGLYFEGYREVGGPGGVWDQVLMEYLRGKRPAPVWALGELDFHGEKLPIEKRIDEVETVFLLPDFSLDSVLIALKTGKIYARWNHPRADLWLNAFEAVSAKGVRAGSGETVASSGKVAIRFEVGCSRGGPEKIQVQIVKNGEIWKTVEGETPLQGEYFDQPREKSYYRLIATGSYPMFLSTNPVFVEP